MFDMYQKQVAAEICYISDEVLPDLRHKIKSCINHGSDSALATALPIEFWKQSLDAIAVASAHIKAINVRLDGTYYDTLSATPHSITS
jgi:hypothetical protein